MDERWEEPIEQTFLEDRLLLGVDPIIIVIMVMIGLFSWLIIRSWLGIPVIIAFWLFCQRIYKEDAKLPQIYFRYASFGDHYEPFPHANLRRKRRPEGFGRGRL